jgi:hypothetical protein
MTSVQSLVARGSCHQGHSEAVNVGRNLIALSERTQSALLQSHLVGINLGEDLLLFCRCLKGEMGEPRNQSVTLHLIRHSRRRR